MNQRRLYYRVLLKVLATLGVLLLLWVFVGSLFVGNDNSDAHDIPLVRLSIADMQKGEIRKIHWQGKAVAVLKRGDLVFNHSGSKEADKSSRLNPQTRSLKAEYFVYFNVGNSGNCPLFYTAGYFKDACTGARFDHTGRGSTAATQALSLAIPPHKFVNDQLVLGAW